MKNNIQDIFDVLNNYISTRKAQDSDMLSLYINIDMKNPANHKERPAWLIEVRNQLSELAEKYGDDILTEIDSELTWKAVENRIIDKVESLDLKGRSIAIFTDFEEDFVVQLPLPVQTKAYYGIPQVKQLLSLLHRYGKYLVILFSETEHRILSVDLPAELEEGVLESGIDAGVFLRPGGRKARTQASERRALDAERRVIREAAEEINAYFLETSEFDRIVFGGNLKIANSVSHALHHTVSDKVVSIEPIPFEATHSQILETVKMIAEEYESLEDVYKMKQLIIRRETCGRAAVGKEAVLEALSLGQVKTLYIPYPIESDEFDPLLIKGVQAGADIELVHGEAAQTLNYLGGAGATLYYTFD
ncbi:hypothetical protein C9J01_08655 [Photobacterium rosenbergii]|uniref:Uncharacterized protein n=1 Tax=Photobacterium rosenbergii TaxID=294936 RepID=A0A2T3NHI8_9GAMM|nr:hypothetical protein [Photobacterium rosenbergii]PSW14492.1 hypothetical protein C9J01_08655 [Photobacterium rosenbergii]